jgi:hypothetical protein
MPRARIELSCAEITHRVLKLLPSAVAFWRVFITNGICGLKEKEAAVVYFTRISLLSGEGTLESRAEQQANCPVFDHQMNRRVQTLSS